MNWGTFGPGRKLKFHSALGVDDGETGDVTTVQFDVGEQKIKV